MGTALAWVLANKALTAGLAAAILSEILPFLPTKYNGILHFILQGLKDLSGKK